jgi:hypothetical protein
MPIDFPAEFPLDFGEFTAATESLDGTSLAWIESHCENGRELLLEQFKNKPRLEAVLCALLGPVQELDDACWQLLTGRAIDNAVGLQLDGIGQIVNLARLGWTDDQYRRFLRAQPLVLRSTGTWASLFAILEALGLDISLVVVEDSAIAEARIQVNQAIFDGLLADVFVTLQRAKPAGVRLLFEAGADAPATTFTYTGSTLITSASLGYSSTVAASGGAYAGAAASSPGA